MASRQLEPDGVTGRVWLAREDDGPVIAMFSDRPGRRFSRWDGDLVGCFLSNTHFEALFGAPPPPGECYECEITLNPVRYVGQLRE